MARYTKTYSNYILKKRHKEINGGIIIERDWGTLGERHVIEPGKRRVYADSNFLFTDNTTPGTKYRNNTGEWSEPYTQDTLGDKIDKTVNDTSLLDDSNDIRDYAYYGSAAELVRASVENIIKWFPGKVWSTDDVINRVNQAEDGWLYIKDIITDGHHNYAIEYTDNKDDCLVHVVRNPFDIDFYTTNKVMGKYDNTLRNMPLSWKQYIVNDVDFNSWNVWIQPYQECVNNFTIKYDITFTYTDVEGIDRTKHLYGIVNEGDIIWCTKGDAITIQPKQSIIDEYFKNLDGFEAKLLNRVNNPQYTARFVTPIQYNNNNPNYAYVERAYSWPYDGYCISVDTIGFDNYFNSLYNMAVLMDELWCDNLWKNMTHESIKNFDWTYTKQYEEGQEEENILGGTRMEGVLRIWGRCFDDVKRYVDGIKLKNCITYDDSANLANAELSDKAGLMGWEIYSTKISNSDNIYLTNDFIDNNIEKLDPIERWGADAFVTYDKWYTPKNPEAVSQNSVDNDFMNRLILSTSRIFKSKGTKEGIRMVLAMFGIGDNDIEFHEKYYTVTPKNRNELFCFYQWVQFPEHGEQYEPLAGYNDLEEYLSENPAQPSSPQHILVGGKCYDLRIDMTVGDFCEHMTYVKSAELNYQDDEFSGYPIKDVYINNEHYIVPYFSQDRIYDGNVQFETKGGWGKMTEADYSFDNMAEQKFGYLETIPYMDIVQNVGELLNVNAYQIGNKSIFYVMDISDITNYVEDVPRNISNLFKLQSRENPSVFSSWSNIPSDGYVDVNYDIFIGVSDDDLKLAAYVNQLTFDNLGNNPHCGYSDYDLGTEYLEYLKEPFKHPADTFGFTDIVETENAKQFKFDIVEQSGEKIVNLIGNTNLEYILPSKVLVLKLNVGNDFFKEYFKEVVLKYVLQVIPSTTILLVDGTDYGYYNVRLVYGVNGENVVDGYIQYGTVPELSSFGLSDSDVVESGYNYSLPEFKKVTGDAEYTVTYTKNTSAYYYTGFMAVSNPVNINEFEPFEDSVDFEMKDLTIIALPDDKEATIVFTSNGIESVVKECNEQPCLVSGDFVVDIPDGYRSVMYYFDNINADTAQIIIE